MATFEARSRLLARVLVAVACACAPAAPATGPGPGPDDDEELELTGIDTADLTSVERHLWARGVSTLAAPCPGVTTAIAACVQENRPCPACTHAAALLKDQVRMGKSLAQIEAAYTARFSPQGVRHLELGNSPSLGDPAARVVIVEWADFECAYCGEASAILQRLLEKYPRDIRLVFKHFPISAHRHAEFAARAAVAAHEQGKFWEFHGLLFANQAVGLGEQRVRQLAQEVGVDMGMFEQSVASPTTKGVVTADREQALRLGAKGTPTVFVNGRLVDSAHFSLGQDLEPWIRVELKLTSATAAGRGISGQGS